MPPFPRRLGGGFGSSPFELFDLFKSNL
jgi:hypothetical protein